MVQAPTQITVTPAELGKHLRSIRRKKGLSLSEVARGAGLNRRELVAYERGKVPIPESDLWVLAGSCGVDVAELVPSTSPRELAAAADATSVSDTVSQLRRTQEDAGIVPYLHTLHKLQALPPGKRIPVKERELDQIASALGTTPRSIEQKLQDVLHVTPDEAERLRAMILVPPNGRKHVRALASAAPTNDSTPHTPDAPAATPPVTTPVTTLAPPPSPPAASEPIQTIPSAPAPFLDAPRDAPVDPVNGGNVDVFEELARLPEPVPLADASAPIPDLLETQDPFALSPLVPVAAPPDGAVELVDTSMPSAATGTAGGTADDGVPPVWDAADAPPIDVAMRQGSSIWDLGEPLTTRTEEPAPEAPDTWETDGWQPPAPDGVDGAPLGFWEGTDDNRDGAGAVDPTTGAPLDVEPAAPEPIHSVDGGNDVDGDAGRAWAGSAWDPEPWTPDEPAADASGSTLDVNPWRIDEWPQEPAERGPWDHRPDQAAVDSGFFVDWGTGEADTRPASAWDAQPDTAAPTAEAADGAFAVDEPATETGAPSTWEDAAASGFVVDWPAEWDANGSTASTAATGDAVDADDDALADDALAPDALAPDLPDVAAHESEWELAEVFEADADVQTDDSRDAEGGAELTPISWRADIDEPIDEPAEDVLGDTAVLASAVSPTTETEIETIAEHFVAAGPDWELGNALPLVEVRGQGALVMRRADERWALADVTTTRDFAVEVEVDFRSGPGLGVLFRASVDGDGRMSGYSFDIDPIYDGGGYLVRQWHADRELWNPIARVSGDDPSSMYGKLLVRLVVEGEHLSASVNGVEVLTVENLEQASVERGRDAAAGDRVGVQAWSSSDLVIDTVRVAAR